ncbi:hypothetical protein ACUDAC_26615, partial [Escherichia coli]
MIIWINGPFGAGKTTLAKRLRDRRSKSLIFDPEEIGFVVKETVPMPASGDYQDLPLWRGLTIAAVREIRRNYSQDIIIPMTLVHPDYLTEILDGVRRIGTVAKLAMRQPFVLFKGLTFQKLCLPGAFRPGDHHNKMLRPG